LLRGMSKMKINSTLRHQLACDDLFSEQIARQHQQRKRILRRSKRKQRGRARDRARAQLQGRRRYNTERSLGSDQEMAQIVAGVALTKHIRRPDDASVGKDRFDPQNLIARHAVANDVVSTGVGG
jgi:hypothetical protein